MYRCDHGRSCCLLTLHSQVTAIAEFQVNGSRWRWVRAVKTSCILSIVQRSRSDDRQQTLIVDCTSRRALIRLQARFGTMPLLKSPTILKSPSPSALRAHLAQTSPTPLLLPDLVDTSAWPALKSWSLSDGLQSLRTAIGENTEVDVELGPRGRGYMDKRYQRVGMGFGQSSLPRSYRVDFIGPL